MFTIIFYYVLVGLIIVAFTPARKQVLQATKHNKYESGKPLSLYKNLVLHTLVITVGVLLWPVLLLKWFGMLTKQIEPNESDKHIEQLQREVVETPVVKRNPFADCGQIPYVQLADMVLNYAVAVSSESADMVEKITTVNIGKVNAELLLKEVIAYYSNVAIATIMVKYSLHGKDNYNQIETNVFEALCKTFGKTLAQYLPLVDKQNRHIAEMYFVKDHDGLAITEEQVYAFAKKYNQEKILAEYPDDQLSIYYYTMRVARVLKVDDLIDSVIVFSISRLLVNRLMMFQDEIKHVIFDDALLS